MYLYLFLLLAILGAVFLIFGIILIRSNHIHDVIVYPWICGFNTKKIGGKK